MRTLLLSVATPEMLSSIGFVLLAGGLLGEVGVEVLSPKWKALHRALVFIFATIVLIGYLPPTGLKPSNEAILHSFARCNIVVFDDILQQTKSYDDGCCLLFCCARASTRFTVEPSVGFLPNLVLTAVARSLSFIGP